MHLSRTSTLLHLLAITIIQVAAQVAERFNITAISAVNGTSTFECWQLTAPLLVSDQKGLAGTALQQLGGVTNASWSHIPANFAGTPHSAPTVQYVVFLSGATQITIPNSKEEAWFLGGRYGLIIAADTADVSPEGHSSSTGSQSVTGLQIPIEGGVAPGHEVLHHGTCLLSEMNLEM